MFWKRNLGHRSFFTVCKPHALLTRSLTHWEGKVKTILDEINNLKLDIAQSNKFIVEEVGKLSQRNTQYVIEQVKETARRDQVEEQAQASAETD